MSWRTTPSDHVSLLLGNTGGVYPKTVGLGAKDGPISIGARDLNGDDLPDIVVANYNSDEVVVMLALVTGPCNDGDGDGYGDPASPECPYPHRDCNDGDPNVNPGVAEDCDNEKDDDCDGFVDSDDPDCNQECIDNDGDGFGDPGSPTCADPRPDCNDNDPLINPGATEIPANGINENCDGNACFIATAAFGTAPDGRIDVIRTFRDEYLLTNAKGRAFVSAYYRYSPPVARYIEQRAWLRMVVRTLLLPLIGFVTLLC